MLDEQCTPALLLTPPSTSQRPLPHLLSGPHVLFDRLSLCSCIDACCFAWPLAAEGACNVLELNMAGMDIGSLGAPAGSAGAPSRPPTGTTTVPVTQRSVGTMANPHAVPLPPLHLPGVPPAPPQLMGSLPFSPLGDTSHFGVPFRPDYPEPDMQEPM